MKSLNLTNKNAILQVHLAFARTKTNLFILFPNKDGESKMQDLKIVYNIKNNGKTETKRIVSKILKMDENNQYGNAMTKPPPCGCIKNKKKFLDFKNLTLSSKICLMKIRLSVYC